MKLDRKLNIYFVTTIVVLSSLMAASFVFMELNHINETLNERAKLIINELASKYGNYMYAETEINGGIPVGEPKHVYNIGADWYLTRDIAANLNVNGFVDMYHGKSADDRDLYWGGWQEQQVDLIVAAENILDRFSVTVYGTNLLNNKIHVGMTGYPGYTYLEGISIGGRISASF